MLWQSIAVAISAHVNKRFLRAPTHCAQGSFYVTGSHAQSSSVQWEMTVVPHWTIHTGSEALLSLVICTQTLTYGEREFFQSNTDLIQIRNLRQANVRTQSDVLFFSPLEMNLHIQWPYPKLICTFYPLQFYSQTTSYWNPYYVYCMY